MTKIAPILQRIHDQFDTFDRYPYTDHTVTTKANLKSASNHYTIMTYPGGCGSSFDGLVLDIDTDGGIFADSPPVRVQTSRDMGNLMVLKVKKDDEILGQRGVIDTPPKIEGLVLPGDNGFELFTELHSKLQALKQPFESTIATLGVNIDPQELVCTETGGSQSYDHERRITTNHRGLAISVGDEEKTLSIKLDGTVQVPFANTIGATNPGAMVFRSGGAILRSAEKHESMELGLEPLVAFAGLHAQISRLYK